MADNRIYEHGRRLSYTCTHPTSPTSGCPVRIGNIIGVALTDEDADGKTTVDIGLSVYDLSVKGVDGDGNSAVSIGDKLYYVDADVDDGTGFLSKKASGYFAGIALEAVNSAATATVKVLIGPAVGVGLGDQTVPRMNVVSKQMDYDDFTDNTNTTGYCDFTDTLPAGAIPVGWKAVVATGFTGDTTAVIQVGVDGDLDRFSEATDQSVLAAATVGGIPPSDTGDGMNAAQTPRVTVTGAADFTSISAGSMTVYLYYVATV